MEIEFTPPFREFLTLMNRHHVEFMIIGGYAVNFHGFPRLTHDIDLLIGIEKENINRLRQTLNDFGFPMDALRDPLFTKEKTILRFGIAPNRVEIFSKIPGVNWNECWENRVTATTQGIELNWIGLRELRKNKFACDRGKDQIDLEELPEA